MELNFISTFTCCSRMGNVVGHTFLSGLFVHWTYLHFLFLTGLDSEGIYRISGFADDVEALKNSFDKGKPPVLTITEI